MFRRFALISFEFPPSDFVGGIGAYADGLARALAQAGIEVWVFAANANTVDEVSVEEVGLDSGKSFRVCRIRATSRETFRELLPPVFFAYHSEVGFEIVESPEVGAEGLPVFRSAANLLKIVKLHTPSNLIYRHSSKPPSFLQKLRFFGGGLRRGKLTWLQAPTYDPLVDQERQLAFLADHISAPCHDLREFAIGSWGLHHDRISVSRLPFMAKPALLELLPPRRIKTIAFLGRLESRKGVFELFAAWNKLAGEFPELEFRCIGPSWPTSEGDSVSFLTSKYPRLASRVAFLGAVPSSSVPSEIARCDVVVLPSRWENFPYACWESMAAARIVVGSKVGGMADVIEDGVSGFHCLPYSASSILNCLRRLLIDFRADELVQIGLRARDRVSTYLDPEIVVKEQLAIYADLVSKKQFSKC